FALEGSRPSGEVILDIAIKAVGLCRDANAQAIVERQGDARFIGIFAVGTAQRTRVIAKLVARRARCDVERAGDRIVAEVGGLRTLEDLDTVHVEQGGACRARAAAIDTIDKGTDRLLEIGAQPRAYAPNIDEFGCRGARYAHVRDMARQILKVP